MTRPSSSYHDSLLFGAICSILLAIAVADPAGAAQLRVSVDWVQGRPTADGEKVTISVLRRNAEAAEAPHIVSIEADGEAILDLAADVVWRVRAEAGGFWGEEQEIRLSPDGDDVHVPLWPGGALRGELAVADGAELPPTILVRLYSIEDTGRYGSRSEASLSCPISETTLLCPAPIGLFDAVITSAGHGPVRRWRLDVRRNENHDLGQIHLAAGTSVIGLVATSDGSPLPRLLEVELARPGGDRAESPAAVAATGVSEHGFFQFTGVAPGTYVARVFHESFVKVATEPFLIADALEVVLEEPLFITPAATLEVTVSPPLGPFDKTWEFRLQQVDSAFSKPVDLSDSASLSGYWKKEGLPNGRYKLTLKGDFPSEWGVHHLDVEKGRQLVQITVGVVVVSGQVKVGREPLPARVVFSRGGPETAIEMNTSADATFQGFLPAEGLWLVDVHSAGIDYPQRTLDVLVSETGLVARAEIELPDTVVEGYVLNQHGLRMANAQVIISRKVEQGIPRHPTGVEFGRFGDQPSLGEVAERTAAPTEKAVTISTDENGEFVARGLLPGDVVVRPVVQGARESHSTRLKIFEGQINRLPPLIVQIPEEDRSQPPSFLDDDPSGPKH